MSDYKDRLLLDEDGNSLVFTVKYFSPYADGHDQLVRGNLKLLTQPRTTYLSGREVYEDDTIGLVFVVEPYQEVRER